MENVIQVLLIMVLMQLIVFVPMIAGKLTSLSSAPAKPADNIFTKQAADAAAQAAADNLNAAEAILRATELRKEVAEIELQVQQAIIDSKRVIATGEKLIDEMSLTK